MVRSRRLLINHVRRSVKSFGARLPACSAESFARAVEGHLPALLYDALAPALELIRSMTEQIRAFDRGIEQVSEASYPETAHLRQVSGVGALTALCCALVLEDPTRFTQRRSVGAYLGLTPRIEHASTNVRRSGPSAKRATRSVDVSWCRRRTTSSGPSGRIPA